MESRREPRRLTARALTHGTLAGALCLAALTGCSGTGSSGNRTDNAGNGSRNTAAPVAPPGKYSTLPEPCGSVSGQTLHALLPDSQNYDGTATPTYDTDRRVGCRWTGSVPGGGSRFLHIDFERLVSYDPSVSDDDRAAQEYARLATAAHVPTGTPSAGAGAASTPATAAPTAGGTPAPAASATPGKETSTTPRPSSSGVPDGGTAPREVGGIGDEAFLNDVLSTQDSGVHRDVTLVFRDANVLVTVEFSQWSSDKSAIPPSADLQLGAHGLAQELARKIDQ